jgi:hypothetical protein
VSRPGFTDGPVTELQALAHRLAKEGQAQMQAQHPKCAVVVLCITPDSLLSPDVAISGQLSHDGVALVLKNTAQQMAIDITLERAQRLQQPGPA